MDSQARVEQAQQRLAENLEVVRRNPEAVLNGSFSGRSGPVTVWVDALGRVESIRIDPKSFSEGEEAKLTEHLNTANSRARRAAETLDFDGQGPAQDSDGSSRKSDIDNRNEWTDDAGGSFLQSF